MPVADGPSGLSPVSLAPVENRLLVETASLTGAIIFIIGCATAHGLGTDAVPASSQQLARARWARDFPAAPYGFSSRFSIPGLRDPRQACSRAFPRACCFGPLLFSESRGTGPAVHEVHYAMVVILAMGQSGLVLAARFGVRLLRAGLRHQQRSRPTKGLKQIWGYIAALLFGPPASWPPGAPGFSTGFPSNSRPPRSPQSRNCIMSRFFFGRKFVRPVMSSTTSNTPWTIWRPRAIGQSVRGSIIRKVPIRETYRYPARRGP